MISEQTLITGLLGNTDIVGVTYLEADGELWVRGVDLYADPVNFPFDELEAWRVIHP